MRAVNNLEAYRGGLCETSIDNLAHMLFVCNTQGNSVTLSAPCLSSPKALFLFCVDLLMRGLLLTYSGDGLPALSHSGGPMPASGPGEAPSAPGEADPQSAARQSAAHARADGRMQTPLPVHLITDGQFAEVARKMACAGIRVTRATSGCPFEKSEVNLDQVMAQPADLDLPMYVLRVQNRGAVHEISFAIFHNTDGKACVRSARVS